MTQPNGPTTMVAAIAALEAEGYAGQFTIEPEGIRTTKLFRAVSGALSVARPARSPRVTGRVSTRSSSTSS